MNAPPILQRHPALRWLAPVGIACVAGLAATGFFSSRAGSSGSLPATTPAALIAAARAPQVDGFSGTVVTHLSLGLPDLPDLDGVSGSGSTSFATLLSGSHTMQVWYGGLDRQRIAVLGATDETDLFRDGDELWQWSSADRTAVHARVPAALAGSAPSGIADLTPLELARRLLAALPESTEVSVDRDHEVADRSAYDLVLTPRSTATKIGEIRIAVDGQTKVPLAVQVQARGATTPAVDIGFTKISFGHQAARSFRFTPPADARVREMGNSLAAPEPSPEPRSSMGRALPARPAPRVTGTGWSTVLDLPTGSRTMTALRHSAVLSSLTPVSGSWGRGYLLDSDLVSALVTTDGRVLVGAVPPSALYAAAGRK